jgi:hypothetical protein
MSTAQFVRGSEVTRPTPEPVTSSVLDHAAAAGNVVTIPATEGFGLRNDEGLWPSYNCLDLLTPTATCPNPTVGEKTFKRAEWQPGFVFAVYGGVECSAIGLDVADQKAETQRVFEASEGKGVEQALLYTRFAASESGDDFPWEDVPDLTPTTGIPLTVALALLEGDAAANYVGLPTIHMPRAAATVLEVSGLIVWNGDLAFTKNGSKVAIGGGYDDPTMLASGQWTMYATGEVYVEKSEQVKQNVYVIPGEVDPSSEGNLLTENAHISFAERMYRVAIDCYAAQVTATVWV